MSKNLTSESEPLSTTAQDRRREPRLRSLLPGKIVFDSKCTMMDCTVRNISASGARVVMADAYRLRQEFNLRIPHRDEMYRATVVWRKGDFAGFSLSAVKDIERPGSQGITRGEAARAHQKEIYAVQF